MKNGFSAICAVALMIGLIPLGGWAALVGHSQVCEWMILDLPDQFASEGWQIFGKVFAPDGTGLGEQHVVRDDRSAVAAPVPSGHYRSVLTTLAGRVSRSGVLLK